MAEAQEKVDMSALKDTFLECPVCVEHFNQTDRRPRLLITCLHAFCTQCLQQLLAKEGKGQITCPLCRQVHNVPGKADSLPLDPVRSKLVEFVDMKKEGNVPCTDCRDGNTAESRCQECSLYLCKQCIYVHKRHQLTHDHQIISLTDALQQPLNMISKRHCCTRHPKHQLEFFCVTDDTLCCMSCTVVEHKGHDFQKLEDVAKKRQEELESLMQAVHTNAQQLRQRRMCEEKSQKAIVQAQRMARSDVKTYFSNMTSILNQRKARLDQDVDQRSETKLALSKKEVEAIDNTLAVIDSTETYFTQARDKADVVEMLQMYPAIKNSLEASGRGQGQGQGRGQGRSNATEPAATFSASNGKLVEKLLSEVGCVREGTNTQIEKNQLLLCFDEVVDAALQYISKNELLKHLQEKAITTDRTRRSTGQRKDVFVLQLKTGRTRTHGPDMSKDLGDLCSNCLDSFSVHKKLPCGHTFCPVCIRQAFDVKPACPVCGKLYGIVKGNQPKGGKMTYSPNRHEVLPGYDDARGLIEITYEFPGGRQQADHLEPGKKYSGITRTAYLPYNDEGWEVLQLLHKAFDAGVTFTIGDSRNNGRSGVITWNDISHKTSKTGRNGYPDPDYLKIVKMELSLKGITASTWETNTDQH